AAARGLGGAREADTAPDRAGSGAPAGELGRRAGAGAAARRGRRGLAERRAPWRRARSQRARSDAAAPPRARALDRRGGRAPGGVLAVPDGERVRVAAARASRRPPAERPRRDPAEPAADGGRRSPPPHERAARGRAPPDRGVAP